MVYKKAKQRVRRIYSHGKSILRGDIFKNPIMVGLAMGGIKNVLSGKKIIDIEDIKNRISKVDGSNPLIFLGLGILAKNPLITAISLYGIVDPPDVEKKEELLEYSNVGGNEETVNYTNIGGYEETVGYSNVGETEKTEPKKRFVY